MCRCLVKYILFFVNLLFTICGLLLIGLGIALVYLLNSLLETLSIPETFSSSLNFLPYTVISLGVIVCIIAFSGCCGAIMETKCLLITYAVCMAVLATAKIVLIIILFVNLDNYTNKAEEAVNKAFEATDSAQNVTFHAIEALFKCCGTYGPDSYVNDYNLTAPTCCEDPTNNHICPKEEAFQTGCTTMIGEGVTLYLKLSGYGLIGIFVFELVVLIFSIYIIKTMNSESGAIVSLYGDEKY